MTDTLKIQRRQARWQSLTQSEPMSLRTGFRHIITIPAQALCVRLRGLFFESSKSFVLPSAWDGLRDFMQRWSELEAMGTRELLIVGHTDTQGSDRYNDELSVARARRVAELLQGDVDAWCNQYDLPDGGKPWSRTEDLHLLAHLKSSELAGPYYQPDQKGSLDSESIRTFQREHGCSVDGKIGPETRRAMIDAYMKDFGVLLDASAPIQIVGCGERRPDMPTKDGVEAAENRRVELFVFLPKVRPFEENMRPPRAAALYPEWIQRVVEEYEHRPNDGSFGNLRIVTGIPVEHAGANPWSFELFSVSGSYRQSITIGEDSPKFEGFVQLLFEQLPRSDSYTLQAHGPEGESYEVFADIPYFELSELTDAIESVDIDDPEHSAHALGTHDEESESHHGDGGQAS